MKSTQNNYLTRLTSKLIELSKNPPRCHDRKYRALVDEAGFEHHQAFKVYEEDSKDHQIAMDALRTAIEAEETKAKIAYAIKLIEE